MPFRAAQIRQPSILPITATIAGTKPASDLPKGHGSDQLRSTPQEGEQSFVSFFRGVDSAVIAHSPYKRPLHCMSLAIDTCGL